MPQQRLFPSSLLHLRLSRRQRRSVSSVALHLHCLCLSHLPWRGSQACATTSPAAAPPRVSRLPMPAADAACSSRRRPVRVAVNLRRESNVLPSTRVLLWCPDPNSAPVSPGRGRLLADSGRLRSDRRPPPNTPRTRDWITVVPSPNHWHRDPQQPARPKEDSQRRGIAPLVSYGLHAGWAAIETP